MPLSLARHLPWLFAALAALNVGGVHAESSCSSDDQPPRSALVERFISADCDTCWTELRAPLAQSPAVGIEWILPGQRGDEAPLSAAARSDGTARLQALRQSAPGASAILPARAVATPSVNLRVAHGLAFHGYIAVSIEMRPRATPAPAPWKAWLLLVELIPAGRELSQIDRILVRNSLQLEWDSRRAATPDSEHHFFESRPMQIPEGAEPGRLAVLGWVEDARGQLHGLALSQCESQRHMLVESGTGPKILAPGFFAPVPADGFRMTGSRPSAHS